MTISDACAEFLDKEAAGRNLRPATVEGYRSLFGSLLRWSSVRGVSLLKDLDEDQVRTWIASWTCQSSTARRRLTQMKAFFRAAVNRGWVTRSPLEKILPPQSEPPPARPLSMDEMRSLLAASAQQPRERGLLLLMRYSGLAIADAATLRRDALEGSELTLRRTKSGEPVTVELPPVVVAAITGLHNSSPDYFWWSGRGARVTAAKYWRSRLRTVARAAGVPDFRPHRLRDTFVVSLLTAGASMSDVCAVLGHHDVQAMECRYARWYRRQDRLSRIVREAEQLDPILLELLGNAITSAALAQV